MDPATAILEVAVHKTFSILDTLPHTLTWARVNDPTEIFVVDLEPLPNPNWPRPGTPGAGQQAFWVRLLAADRFDIIPDSVSTHGWILLFHGVRAAGAYTEVRQEVFVFDTRLHPAGIVPSR